MIVRKIKKFCENPGHPALSTFYFSYAELTLTNKVKQMICSI